jgi:hypothetical protein
MRHSNHKVSTELFQANGLITLLHRPQRKITNSQYRQVTKYNTDGRVLSYDNKKKTAYERIWTCVVNVLHTLKKKAVLKLMMTCDNKHLGQGDVMSSSLCNIDADMLAILTAIAKNYGKGL